MRYILPNVFLLTQDAQISMITPSYTRRICWKKNTQMHQVVFSRKHIT